MTSIIKADNISTVAGTGTISVAAGNKIVAPAGGLVAPGGVIQVVQTVLTSRTSTTYQTENSVGADLGLNVTIVPKLDNSKFLVEIHVGAAGSSGASWGVVLSRNGTRIGNGDDYSGYTGSGLLFRSTWVGHVDYNHTTGGGSGKYLDAPSLSAGTSITYKCGFIVQSGTLYVNSDYNRYSGSAPVAHSTSASSITVMEIAQ